MKYSAAVSAVILAAAPLVLPAASPAATQSWVAGMLSDRAARPSPSPAATQAWVWNYVATSGVHVVTGDVAHTAIDLSPVSAAVTNDQGEAETVTILFTRSGCRALRVEDSNVDGMTNGTIFAKNGTDSYGNTGNAACTAFAGATETNGEYRFVVFVRGESFFSHEARPGYHTCTSAVLSARHFSLRSCMITEATRAAVLAPRLSLLSALCPTAWAVTLGEKELVDEWPIYNPDGVMHRYRQRYFTDESDAEQVGIGPVSITSANGNPITYEFYIPLIDIPAGMDVAEVSQMGTPDVSEIWAALEAAIGRNRTRQFMASDDAVGQMNEKIAAAAAKLAAFAGYAPVFTNEPEYFVHSCSNFTGSCGKWKCTYCGIVHKAPDEDHPATHDYKPQGDGLCHRCRVCGESPADQDTSIHGGWHDLQYAYDDGDTIAHVCRCECGYMALPHEHGATVRYEADTQNPAVCVEVWRCARCGEVVTSEGWRPNGGTFTLGAHDESTDGVFHAVTDGTNDICRLLYSCHHVKDGVDLGCGAERVEDMYHLIDASKSAITSIGDTTNHTVVIPCVNGLYEFVGGYESWATNNPAWCGYLESTNVPHRLETERLAFDDPYFPASASQHAILHWCGELADTGEGYEATGDGSNTCGRVWAVLEDHDSSGGQRRYFVDDERHAVSNKCGMCGTTYPAHPATETHTNAIERHIYATNGPVTHSVSNWCGGCASWYSAGSEAHFGTNEHAYAYLSDQSHEVSNRCTRCGDYYFRDIESHAADPTMLPSSYESDGDWTHTEFAVCGLCRLDGHFVEFTWRRHQECTNSTDATHWTLRDGEDTDLARCQFCTNTHEVAHDWRYVDRNSHRCMNGASHLWEGHRYVRDGSGWKCKCGDTIPDSEGTLACPDCDCTPENCETWDGDKCGCLNCKNGLASSYYFCTCCYVRDLGTPGLKYRRSFQDGGAFVAPFSVEGESTSGVDTTYGNGTILGDVVIAAYVDYEGKPVASTNGYSGIDMERPLPVTGIDAGVVRQIDDLFGGPTSITGPYSLTSVADYGIANISNLVSVFLPGATTFGVGAFAGCVSIESISLPEAREFGDYAFMGCESITNIVLPKVVTIGLYAFSIGPEVSETLHLHLMQTNVTAGTFDHPPAAIHFPSNRSLNGVSYPAETIELGGHEIPIVWEPPYND